MVKLSLADLRIGQKIGFIFGLTVCGVISLAVVAVWSMRAIHADMKASERDSHLMALAEGVRASTAAIGQRVAVMTLAGKTDPESIALIKSIRTDYLAKVQELKSAENTDEGRSLFSAIEFVTAQWREADNSLFTLLDAGQKRRAEQFHRDQVAPKFGELASKSAAYARFREQELNEVNRRTEVLISRITLGLIGYGALAAFMASMFGIWLTRNIASPLGAAVMRLEQISNGDVSCEVSRENQSRKDEIGDFARAMQKMILALRNIFHEISSGVQVLSSSSAKLTDNSTSMMSGSRDASGRMHSVSAAVEQMSSNITSVAAGMEQTTTNLSHVTAATEQMTSTISEIARNSEKARRITDEATRQAGRITEQIDQLGLAAREIGKVTETITEISSQTNLLALNATIEAARAGAAGKGFAVVATEIKALAQQTAAATEDIKGRITGVQSATAGGIAEIGKISQVILDVSGIVASIAAAIEEQAAATKDIARNISEASTGVTDANTRVAETSQVSSDVARDLVRVDQGTAQIATASGEVLGSAGEVSSVAEALRVSVAHFKA